MHPLVFTEEHSEDIPVVRNVYRESAGPHHEQDPQKLDAKTLLPAKPSGGKQIYKSSRGRPRADVISSLILTGSEINGKIRCDICNRIFPREKSLQAHMRTHTGERPYVCDFPGCSKAFCQSGQLKTHQRLHTGEKPFACCVDGCSSRFTHANRHCSEHPYAGLRRVETHVTGPEGYWDYDDHAAIRQWLNKQAERKQARSPTKQPRKLKREHSTDDPSDDDYVSSSQSSRTSQSDISLEEDVGSLQSSPTDRDDHYDKWIGALALIELASGFHAH
ncbi:zinc finger protein 367-like [Babylonia areolata]|uniref:zinc finger protein 367-like n=1 Tax=Babylonia areolata TaxID=304850 RepID=UPI003FCFA615